MLHHIRIKSLEDIALGLIKRDNETKKDYYNYHDTVKELEYKIKSNNIQNLNTKEDLKIITDAKKVRKIQGEINNSNGNQNKPIKKVSCGKQLKENKKSKQKNYGVKNNINENKTKENKEENFIIKIKKDKRGERYG